MAHSERRFTAVATDMNGSATVAVGLGAGYRDLASTAGKSNEQQKPIFK
jgi:hypothetical protein